MEGFGRQEGGLLSLRLLSLRLLSLRLLSLRRYSRPAEVAQTQ